MNSDKQIGDAVVLNFGEAGLIRNCFVDAIKFSEGKVRYDVKVYPFLNEPNNAHLFELINDVDSYYVEHPTDRFVGKTNLPFILE